MNQQKTSTMDSIGPDTLVKALKADRTHYGYTYVPGLNICPQPFNAREFADGGFYACRLKDLFIWALMYPDIDTVALVEIPENARRCEFETKIKASALVLTHFIPLITALEFALKHGADVHANNDEALIKASYYGHLHIVQFLVAHGADVHTDDDYTLHMASKGGHLPVVQFLVEVGHANIHTKNEYALRWASNYGHLHIVQFLVAHGADIHAKNDEALHFASSNGHLPVVRFLVEQGADVHADEDAIRWAYENGHMSVVEFLKSLP